jgi:hypothetical protein
VTEKEEEGRAEPVCFSYFRAEDILRLEDALSLRPPVHC